MFRLSGLPSTVVVIQDPVLAPRPGKMRPKFAFGRMTLNLKPGCDACQARADNNDEYSHDG